MTPAAMGADLRRILALAWPVLIGQLSMIAYGTVDTLLVARHSAIDLAALAVGGAAYVTTFIGLMGAVMAVAPLAGQMFGAGRLAESGHQLHQGVWLALGLALPGCALLLFPWPFLALAQLAPEVEPKARAYLAVLALSLPAALVFAAWRGFNNAVSRPRTVMVLQLAALAVKLPLSWLLIGGAPALGLPALGVVGGAVATAVAMWTQLAAAVWVTQRDPFYAGFGLHTRRLQPPDREALRKLWTLGLPMGGAVLIEVSGFTMMAVFIARLGTTAVAGHQVAVNLVSILFMVPISLAHAVSTLVAQQVGARDLAGAERLGWRGVKLAIAVAALMGGTVFALREQVVGLYTADAVVAAAALSLLAWMVVFHIADAAQILAAFVLRGWQVATGPMVIYALSLWGVGLGGGYLRAFDVGGLAPSALIGARGYWAASTTGVVLAAVGLALYLRATLRRRRGVAATSA